ncbi:hypothetical protein BJ508DRAFT_332741 [Ascobolus immersus RN42]|uniref:Uncharacterized protein n=1 Tax=Ascobolus immersus RN42 TaxID=1160509 RepID=A0A3N4HLW2_ASCIM|nr:hypothetical protein BJ508DRAFT_332741 [Ascobolus immersus RN42]
MPLELGFNVNYGPLSQISVPITPDLATTAVTLAYNGFKFWQARYKAYDLFTTIGSGGIVLSAPPSFNPYKYKDFRRGGPGLSGFGRLASGMLGSTSMPLASTSCDGDSGLQCLRAITTALLCFYDWERTLRILVHVAPGRLLQSELEDDDFAIPGPTVARLRSFIQSVDREEQVDPIRKTLLDRATTAVMELLQDPTVTRYSLPCDLVGGNTGMGRTAGFLIWLLTGPQKRDACYPTASLLVWTLAFTLQVLGFETDACFPKLETGEVYRSHINNQTDSVNSTRSRVYLVTCSEKGVDAFNALSLESGLRQIAAKKLITTTIRGVPYIILKHEFGICNFGGEPLEIGDVNYDRLPKLVLTTLFVNVVKAARQFLISPQHGSDDVLMMLVLCLGPLGGNGDLKGLDRNSHDSQAVGLFCINVWMKDLWRNSLLSRIAFRSGETFRDPPTSFYLGKNTAASRPYDKVSRNFPKRSLYLLLTRALAYAILLAEHAPLASSEDSLDLEVRLCQEDLLLSVEEVLRIQRLFYNKELCRSPYRQLELEQRLKDRYEQLLSANEDTIDDRLRPTHPQPLGPQYWKNISNEKNASFLGFDASSFRKLKKVDIEDSFPLCVHLLTGQPLSPLLGHSDGRLGAFSGGMTVLRGYLFEFDCDEPRRLLVAEGIPLGLKADQDGYIRASSIRCSRSASQLKLYIPRSASMLHSSSTYAPRKLELGRSNVAEFRVDTEVDWEDDEARIYFLMRHKGQSLRILDPGTILSSSFELLWNERRKHVRCSCASPSLEVSKKLGGKVACLEVSEFLNTASLELSTDYLRRIPTLADNGQVHEVRRLVVVAKTAGDMVAQFRALELFLTSTMEAGHSLLVQNEPEPELPELLPMWGNKNISARVHFIRCMRCWEGTGFPTLERHRQSERGSSESAKMQVPVEAESKSFEGGGVILEEVLGNLGKMSLEALESSDDDASFKLSLQPDFWTYEKHTQSRARLPPMPRPPPALVPVCYVHYIIAV